MTTIDAFPDTRVDPGIDSDRRYTTKETMGLCMRLAGVDAWDLDVAADKESHWAPKWYGIEEDGLTQPWYGDVWCNPPWSNIEPWVRKAWEEMERQQRPKTIAMLLPANRTEQPWFQLQIEQYRDNRPARPILDSPPDEHSALREFIQANSTATVEGCWLWKRYTMPKGHGRIRWQGNMELAHRLSFRAWRSEPGDLLVCHRCDVPSCVNPEHLFLGSHQDNMRDRNAKGRTARGDRAARSLPRSRVELIRWLAASDCRRSSIARVVGVASSTVSRILDGKRWSDAPSTDKSPGVTLRTHFLPGRIKYGHPENKDGIGVGSPPFGSVLLVWRR